MISILMTEMEHKVSNRGRAERSSNGGSSIVGCYHMESFVSGCRNVILQMRIVVSIGRSTLKSNIEMAEDG